MPNPGTEASGGALQEFPPGAIDTLGDRLVVGQRTLTPLTEVRILVPQPFTKV